MSETQYLLSYTPIPGGYIVNYTNGVYLGDILQEVDGFYVWYPPHPSRGGYWDSWIIREIANKIDELNAPWEKEINEYFDNFSKNPSEEIDF